MASGNEENHDFNISFDFEFDANALAEIVEIEDNENNEVAQQPSDRPEGKINRA